ncbi:MAG: hypothetical protein ACRDE2_12105 [Chitinophagaceae bacterium]
MMKSITVIFCLASLLIAGCSSNSLTRNDALRILQKEKLFPRVVDYDLFCGDPNYAVKVLDAGLENQGYLTVDRTQKLKDIGKPIIHLTGKADSYLLPTPKEDQISKIQRIKIADEYLNEITGVRMSASGKNAVVEYTVICKNISPFAVLIKRDLRKPDDRRAYFSFYDDGWRIEKKPGVEFIEFER